MKRALNRMANLYLDELEQYTRQNPHPEKFRKFRKALENMSSNTQIVRYFILKSIVVNNLYGVDIMEEAIEICKLRLFLKMVAQIEEAGSD